MKSWLRDYFNSFKVKGEFWYVFCFNAIFFSVIGLLGYWFVETVKIRSEVLMQGKTPEQLQAFFASSTPEQMLPFLEQLKAFLLFFVIIGILLLLLGFLGYSLLQAFSWNYLLKRKLSKNNYWKWNVLQLVLIIPLGLYWLMAFLIMVIVKGMVQFLFNLNSWVSVNFANGIDNFLIILNSVLIFIFVVLFVLILYAIYYLFTKDYQVWSSMGNAFHILKLKIKLFRKSFLSGLVTLMVLELLMTPVRNGFINSTILLVMDIFIFLVFLVWLQIYFVREMQAD
ncbi:hypothetical protein HYX11_00140 [Candidatus Woesearchaeota archaeon]|nr:hypothetical protein [Candidatus Woesearchaeota archaeon]